MQRIFKILGTCLVCLLIIIALSSLLPMPADPAPASTTAGHQTDADHLFTQLIASLPTKTNDSSLTTTVSNYPTDRLSTLYPNPNTKTSNYSYLPIKLYQRDDDIFTEVDYITDDFEQTPERYLYVLEPDHCYYLSIDISQIHPSTASALIGCCIFSNSITAEHVGSMVLLVTEVDLSSTSAQPITYYGQVKFVTEEALSLHHGPATSLTCRAGQTGCQYFIPLTCSANALAQDMIETSVYDDPESTEISHLEIYGAPTGTRHPTQLDADTYLWPSQNQTKELIDITRQLHDLNQHFLQIDRQASAFYAISQIPTIG